MRLLAATDARLQAFLRRAPLLHLYELGDLDPREAEHTRCYGAEDGDELAAVVVIYHGLSVPTLVALGADHRERDALRTLLRALDAAGALPDLHYAHLSPGLIDALTGANRSARSLGARARMGLAGAVRAAAATSTPLSPPVRLTLADIDEMRAFYATAYPESYFSAGAVARGIYVGLRDAAGLACVAGTHVYSPAMRVAALGNIATRPDCRGRGLAGHTTAALVAALADDIDTVGLNVDLGNHAAIACYRRLGFAHIADYEEHRVSPTAAPGSTAGPAAGPAAGS